MYFFFKYLQYFIYHYLYIRLGLNHHYQNEQIFFDHEALYFYTYMIEDHFLKYYFHKIKDSSNEN